MEVPKSAVPSSVPKNFKQSDLSLHLGAQKVYREERATDSVQLRVYEDKYTLQLDRYNPQYYPIKHAVYDATEYTAAALFASGFAYSAIEG